MPAVGTVGTAGTVETVGTVGPVGPVALVLLILQFWLTLLAVLEILAIQLFAIQHLSHLPSFVSLFCYFLVSSPSRKWKFPLSFPSITHLHTEQGVVCHLDRKNGTFLLVEEIPYLEHTINAGGEEHRQPSTRKVLI